MLKLNRRTEYALLALRYLSRPDDSAVSVRTVAQHYAIPESLLAKVLQLLKRSGLASATKGATGGYTLARPLEEITLLEVLEVFDESTNLVDCIEEAQGCDCHLMPSCDIRDGMASLNALMTLQLRHLTVAAFFAGKMPIQPAA